MMRLRLQFFMRIRREFWSLRSAYDLYLKLEGEDAEKTRKMTILDDPTTHQWWGSRKGVSGVAVREDVPMGLSEKAFEEWLWDAEGPEWREPAQEA